MNESFVIWGSAGHAKVLLDVIYSYGNEVILFVDNEEVLPVVENVPLLRGEKALRSWARTLDQNQIKRISAIAAIGGAKGMDRTQIHEIFRSIGFKIPTLIHRSAIVSPSATIGEGSQILAQVNISAGVRIEKSCIINNSASIDHECEIREGVHIGPGAVLCGCVTILENVFIGAGAVILPRTEVGPNCIIGAGAVVTKNVPRGVKAVGNPAKW